MQRSIHDSLDNTRSRFALGSSRGFTIIEVLIVLAIAGLILLIVFLAVPALQRNSRNTQRKQDASRILGGAQEFVTNKAGSLPTASVSSTSGSDAETIYKNANVKQFTTLTVETEASKSASSTTLDSTAWLRTGSKCSGVANPDSNTITTTGPGKGFALVYLIENNSGSAIPTCTSS